MIIGAVNSKQERVAQELARLAVLDRAGCLELWRTSFGCEAPRYLSAVFMRKVLAHGDTGGQPAPDYEGRTADEEQSVVGNTLGWFKCPVRGRSGDRFDIEAISRLLVLQIEA